jgi:histidyl-tRNA synthetase
LGRFVYLAIEKIWSLPSSESYLFVNFEETFDGIQSLYTRFLSEWKICELYPTAAKFGKQLEYADKKWISKVVILGTTEQQEAVYIIKDLATGEQQKIDI